MSTRAPLAKLVLWYCLAIGSVGALHPFLSLALERRGASETVTTLILALFPVGLLFAGPAWGWLADRAEQPTRVMAVALGIAAAGSLLTLIPGGPFALVPGLALLAATRGGAVALGDVHAIASLGGGDEGRARYGRVRMWGSVAFIVAVQGVGLLADRWPRAPLVVNAALVVALALLTVTLPRPAAHVRSVARTALRRVLAVPVLARLFLVSVLHVAAMSSYDNLFGLHGARAGLSDGLIGASFGVGVAAEVVVLFASPLLLARWRPQALLAVAVIAGVPRWWITGTTDSHALLVGIQGLHGLTFGLWWVGGVAFVSQRAPSDLRSSAQAAFVASGFGLGNLLSLLAASALLPILGTPGWFRALAGVACVASALLPWALRDDPRATSSADAA